MSTKEKILSTAAKLFHEKGFSATSVRELASAVGIEAASLYNHMASKQDLLEHLCFETAAMFEKSLDDVSSSGLTPIEKLKSILSFHIELALNDPKSLTVFTQEWRHLEKDKKQAFQLKRKAYELGLQGIIEEGQTCGQIHREYNPEILVKMLLSSVQWLYFIKPKSAKANKAMINSNVELFIENSVEKLTPVS